MNPSNETSDNTQNKPDLASQGQALEPQDENQTSTEKPKRKLPLLKILVAGAVILITLLAFGLIAYLMMAQNKAQVINSYEECVASGFPIMESFPEQCAFPGGYSFTRKLTDEEKRKMSYAEMLGQGKYEGKEYSFEFPTDIFELAYLVCNQAEKEPSLISNSSSTKYDDPRKCALAPYLFEVKKVNEIDDLLSDTTCYSVTRKSISIDDQPATSYTAKFIGTNIDKCKEYMTERYSDTYRYVYVENENQLYLLKWPELIFFDLEPYNQILSTFKFTDTQSAVDPSTYDSNYVFDINNTVIGDSIGKFTVTNISTANNFGSVAEDNFQITFRGEITLTGDYSILDDSTPGILVNEVRFTPDDKSNELLPQEIHIMNYGYTKSFKFKNYNSAYNLLNKYGKKGTKEIIIDNYTLVGLPAEVSFSSDLIDVK